VDGEEFCGQSTFHIKAEIANESTNPDHLKWYIDGDWKDAWNDTREWDLTGLSPGAHTIRMDVTDLSGKLHTFATTLSLCAPQVIPVNPHIRAIFQTP
jgi:hypothetical protein